MVKISRCGQFSVTGTRNLVMGMERHVNKKLYTSTDLQIHFYRTANLGNYIILFYLLFGSHPARTGVLGAYFRLSELKDHDCQGSGDHMGCPRLKLDQSCMRQIT